MTVGFDKDLYVLPFDHRGSFQASMFGWKGTLTADQTAQITAAKQTIYDGFKSAVSAGVLKENAGILVDERFGAAILRDATKCGKITACPAEKSGQDQFDFEYAHFAAHIETFYPTFGKVLVRYSPDGDRDLNRRQAARLRQLSEFLHRESWRLFVFELQVPAEKVPSLMVQAIRQLQDAGVEADVWKIEGLERREHCEKIVATACRGGRDKVGCIVLGRGEDDKKMHQSVQTAAGVAGFMPETGDFRGGVQ